MNILAYRTNQTNRTQENTNNKSNSYSQLLNKKNTFDIFVQKTPEKGEKVTPNEAIKLMLNGVTSQLKGIATEAVKNPLKILVPAVATTGVIMALPLVGIPSAVGASIIAITTAAISTGRLASNIYKLHNNNQQGEYNKARENYKNIGNSTFDLALSLPFLPKAIKSVKDFAKYGKIHVNMSAIKRLKEPANILPTLKKANQELYRGYEYAKIVDSELSTYTMPKAEKAKIRKELLDFNVPEDEIANVVTKKLAKRKGYTHYPRAEYDVLYENFEGSYGSKTGRLRLADKTKPPIPSAKRGAVQNVKAVLPHNETTYKCEMIDSVTGEITYEYAPKKLIDDFRTLMQQETQLSPQGQKITTVVHEFEHFDQHAKMARLNGVSLQCAPKAKKLYKKAIKEHGRIAQNSPLAAEVRRYAAVNTAENKNYIKYLSNAREVGARKIQANAINSPEFQRIEKIFKRLPELQEVNNISESIIPSVIQTTAVNE